ncbi:hypothetical protein [Echinicola sp. 20G]|uniref:hypothetical protein n=1 Tax=Echinicola sp. 20G TaxID=2781961 RepID=UPI00191060E1|nr:hypothetical protein [Echinicola sp. 20G]
MKRLFLYTFILFSFMTIFSCGGSDDPTPSKTPEQIAIEKLAGDGSKTWIVTGGSVTHNGQNETSDFTDFEITFSSSGSSKSYATSNANQLFDASGNWSFAGSNFDKIILSGSQPAAGQEISFSGAGTNLRLEFNVPTPTNGRVTALAGDYRFDLKAQ